MNRLKSATVSVHVVTELSLVSMLICITPALGENTFLYQIASFNTCICWSSSFEVKVALKLINSQD